MDNANNNPSLSMLFTCKTTDAVVPHPTMPVMAFGVLEQSTSLNACILWVAQVCGLDAASLWTQYDMGAWHVIAPGELMERRVATILTIEEPAPLSPYKYGFWEILAGDVCLDGHQFDLR
jgi:hypothetical protein